MKEKIVKWIKEGQEEIVRIEGKSKTNTKMQLAYRENNKKYKKLIPKGR
jgi:hypothetical protein